MRNKLITEDQKQFIFDYYKTKTDKSIAAFLNLSSSAVCNYRVEMGLLKPKIIVTTVLDRVFAEQELNAILAMPYMANFHDSTMSRIKILNNIINGN